MTGLNHKWQLKTMSRYIFPWDLSWYIQVSQWDLEEIMWSRKINLKMQNIEITFSPQAVIISNMPVQEKVYFWEINGNSFPSFINMNVNWWDKCHENKKVMTEVSTKTYSSSWDTPRSRSTAGPAAWPVQEVASRLLDSEDGGVKK